MILLMCDKKLSQDIPHIDLSSKKISNCMGCFGCWTKTPGKCVIRDDATQIYPLIAKSDKVIYVSRLKYGGYDSVMKTMLERAIPVQQAFIRIHNGETHHVQREVVQKDAIIIAYGNISDEEKDIFRTLVERNSHNMNFKSHKIIFSTENMLEETIRTALKEIKEYEHTQK